jgi:hypothetical protein
VRPVAFPAAPKQHTSLWSPFGLRTAPAVTGARIGNRLVLLNLGATAVRVDLTDARRATVLQAPPRARPAFDPTDTVEVTRTPVTGSLLLPPYSEAVVVVGGPR